MQSNLPSQDRKASLFLQFDQHLPLCVRPTTIEQFNEELRLQISKFKCVSVSNLLNAHLLGPASFACLWMIVCWSLSILVAKVFLQVSQV